MEPLFAAAALDWLTDGANNHAPDFAADLLAESESDLRAARPIETTPLPAPPKPPRPPLAAWLLLFAAAAMLAEWGLFQRRVLE